MPLHAILKVEKVRNFLTVIFKEYEESSNYLKDKEITFYKLHLLKTKFFFQLHLLILIYNRITFSDELELIL